MHLWMQQRIFDGFENIDSEQQTTGNSEGRCKRLRNQNQNLLHNIDELPRIININLVLFPSLGIIPLRDSTFLGILIEGDGNVS